jgi:hypothetical protein
MRTAVERFLPRLRDTAQKITTKFNEQHLNPPFRTERDNTINSKKAAFVR